MRLTCSEIARITRGRILSGDPARVALGVSIDSRTLSEGEAFFAIRGEVHDGHRFVAGAVSRGAACAIVHDAAAAEGVPPGTTVILVADTLRALQDLASEARSATRALTIGISGSVGKTTTKDLSALLLAGERVVHATPGNLNNHYGLPLAILRAPAEAGVLVLEMGISTPGEMDRLVEIARPDIGLLTTISPVHVGNFASFADLCEEKMKLPRGSRRALLNADDPEQVSRAPRGIPVSYHGEGELARDGVRLAGVTSRGLLGSLVVLEEGGVRHEIDLPLAGRHQARNLAAAAALARAAGASWESIARQARLAEPGPHRGRVLSARGVTLVDDTYNANPLAMRAALALLREVEPARRRVLVAGDMLELGAISEEEHRSLGGFAGPRVDVLVAVGPEARHVAAGAAAAGAQAVTLPDAESAGRWLISSLAEGDVVLVKGSRGIGLDRAVDAWMARAGAAEAGGRP